MNGKGIKMNLNPNKYSSAIVKTELYKRSLFPNWLFSDYGKNVVNVSQYYSHYKITPSAAGCGCIPVEMFCIDLA